MQLETKVNKPTVKLMIYIICTDVSLCSEAGIFISEALTTLKETITHNLYTIFKQA